jgi:hypothetical protein
MGIIHFYIVFVVGCVMLFAASCAASSVDVALIISVGAATLSASATPANSAKNIEIMAIPDGNVYFIHITRYQFKLDWFLMVSF